MQNATGPQRTLVAIKSTKYPICKKIFFYKISKFLNIHIIIKKVFES